MILADKIINERKRNGWSQEELAEQLGVSRQSISKWEGAQAIPDIQKAFLILCVALSLIPGFPLGEGPMVAIGVVTLLVLIGIAVFFFVFDGMKRSKFEYLETSPIETMYGVTGMVRERASA